MSSLIPAAEVIQPLIKTATHHLAFPVYIGIPNGCTHCSTGEHKVRAQGWISD